MPASAVEDQRQGLAGDGERRRCTDAYCCLLFCLATAAFAFLGSYAVQHRNTEVLDRIQSGRDFKHRICGVDAGVKDFKFVYFTFKLNHTAVNSRSWSAALRSELKPVCTSKCPGADSAVGDKPVPARSSGVCPKDMYPDWCTWYGAETLQIAQYCVDTAAFIQTVPDAVWLHDLKASMWHILIAFPVAVVVGFGFLFVVQHCGVGFVWALLLVAAGIPIAVGYGVHREHGKSLSKALDPKQLKMLEFGLYTLGGSILLLSLCFCRTVSGVADVIKATAKFLKDVPSQMLQPLVFATVHLITFTAWMAVFICFTSMFVQEGQEQQCLEIGNVFCLQWDTTNIAYGIIFLLLMFYWFSNFLHALSHFGTSHAVDNWYKSSADDLTGTCCDFTRTLTGIRAGLGKSVGSLAFGALVVSAAKLVRLLLFWVSKEHDSQSNNQCMKCLFRIMNCLAACLEKCINFVTEHAYVETALNGTAFCESCRITMEQAAGNALMFSIAGSAAFMLRVIGIIVITASSAYAVFLSLVFAKPDDLQSEASPIPLIAAAFCGGIVAEVMLHPMTVTARANLHCYIRDKEKHTELGRALDATPQNEAWKKIDESTRTSGEPSRRCCCF